jgi:hypothetical protein
MSGPRTAGPGGWPALWLLLGACAGGCHQATPHLESVRIAEPSLSAAAESGLDRAAAEAAASQALGEAGFLLTPGAPAYRARVEIVGLQVAAGPEGRGLRMEVRAEVDLDALEGPEVTRREIGAGTGSMGPDGPGPALRAALAMAVGEAGRGLRIGLTSDHKPVEALLADLGSSDVRLRDHAIQALGDRREPRAVPGLLQRLHDGDPRVVDRAIGALSQIKDRRAVPALIELSRNADVEGTLRLVPVVGDLGGRDALGWLLTLQQAHPDGRVRQAAGEALAGLERSGVAAAAPRE